MRAEALRIVTSLRLRRGVYTCSTVARKVWCGVGSLRVLYGCKALASLAIYKRRATLAGMQVEGVRFQAAVADAQGNVIKQTSGDPRKYLARLHFSFRGISEVEVAAERIRGA